MVRECHAVRPNRARQPGRTTYAKPERADRPITEDSLRTFLSTPDETDAHITSRPDQLDDIVLDLSLKPAQ